MKDQDPKDKSTPQSTAPAPETKQKPSRLNETIEAMIFCPISTSMFLKPVTLNCKGTTPHVFEEEAAAQLLAENPKCPTCRTKFTSYTPNLMIKNIIDSVLKDDPSRKIEQYKLGELSAPIAPLETKPPAPAVSTIPATTTTTAVSTTTVTTTTTTATSTSTTATVPPSSQPALSSPLQFPLYPQVSFTSSHATYEDNKAEQSTIDLPTFIIITSEVKTRSHGRTAPPNGKPLIKVLLVGDAETRRSQFLLNISDDTYTPSFITTIGIDFKLKELYGEKFQIWDTAGQERFRTITTAHYKGASVIMLFGTQITDWIRNIKQHIPGQNLQGFIPRYGSSEVFLDPINLSEATNPDIAPEDSRVQACSFGNQLLIKCSALVPSSLAETKTRPTTTTARMPAPTHMITSYPPTAPRASHHDDEEKKPSAIQLPSLVILTNCRKTMSSATGSGNLWRSPMPMTKLILMGNSDTRKIQFALNLVPGNHEQKMNQFDFIRRQINKELYQIWDTAGQERFHSIGSSFYRGASVILIFGTNNTQWANDAKHHVDEQGLRAFLPSYLPFSGRVNLTPIALDDITDPSSITEVSPSEGQKLGQNLLIQCAARVESPAPSAQQPQALDLRAQRPPSSRCCP